MESAQANRIVATASLVTFGIGVTNTVVKKKEWPSREFLIGSAVVFIGISALAEFEPDLAVPMSIAILTTVLLGDGGGVLSYISPKGEINTQRAKDAKDPKRGMRPTSQNPATTPPTRAPDRPPPRQPSIAIPGIP